MNFLYLSNDFKPKSANYNLPNQPFSSNKIGLLYTIIIILLLSYYLKMAGKAEILKSLFILQ